MGERRRGGDRHVARTRVPAHLLTSLLAATRADRADRFYFSAVGGGVLLFLGGEASVSAI